MKLAVAAIVAIALPVAAEPSHDLGKKDPGLYNLKGQIYFLPEGADHMPADLAKQKVQGVIYSEQLDVPERSFTEGFPGVTDRFEWFGIIYTARFQVKTAGKYHFRATTDDGVRLWIDGKQIMENDSIHGADDANADVTLKAGLHDFKLWWFQGPRESIALQLWITPPGGEEKIFSMKDYAGDMGSALAELGGEATPQGIRVRLDASVLFDLDKAALKPAAQAALKKLATVLQSYPTATVEIGGHTSSEGDAAHNQTLSEKRAGTVKDALAKLVPKTVTLTAKGYGSSQPIADNKTEQTRAPNRRVEIFVKP